jgi:hypothetical protein
LPFYFKHFLLTSSSSQAENKKTKKKIHKEEKNAEKGGSLPSSFCFALSNLALVSGLLFLAFRFKCFLLGIFLSSIRKERKTQRKKNHKEEKKCRKGRELTFFLSLLHLG